MTTAQVIVTLAGLAAIAWVLWYFLAPPRGTQAASRWGDVHPPPRGAR